MSSNILTNLHTDASGFSQISCFYDKNKEEFFEKIPVSLCQWFDANMAAPLGAVLDLLENELNDIIFCNISPNIETILKKNGFLKHFGFNHCIDNNNTTIQYQKMKPDDGRYFREYVTTQFINRSELPAMSEGLRKKMIEVMLELFVNAQIHSETKHIYTCGQFFPTRHTIDFCIVDTGIGFKENFLRRFGKTISSIDAIRWAVQDRNTTKIGIPGGIGLALLSEFVALNKGMLQIISNDGYYQYGHEGEKTVRLTKPFPGTVVNITFRTDDNSNYSLANNASNKKDLF